MNSIPEAIEPGDAAARAMPTRTALVTLLRREFWEHRYLLWVPPAFVALLLLLAMFAHVEIDDMPVQVQAALTTLTQYLLAAVLFLIVVAVLSYYTLDCLHAERKDRSILFWKSLPVSDGLTVAAKFLVALVVVPLGAVALALLGHLLFSAILAVRAAFGSVPVAPVWDTLEWLRNVALMLVLLLLAMLWYAPVIAAALLVSGWARKPFLWAMLPPLIVLIVEPIFFRTQYFWHFLQYRSQGIWGVLAQGIRMPKEDAVPHSIASALFANLNWRAAFLDIDLWLGVLVALALLYGATRLRRYHDET
jgi:ABC-2 type transport system permease protein